MVEEFDPGAGDDSGETSGGESIIGADLYDPNTLEFVGQVRSVWNRGWGGTRTLGNSLVIVGPNGQERPFTGGEYLTAMAGGFNLRGVRVDRNGNVQSQGAISDSELRRALGVGGLGAPDRNESLETAQFQHEAQFDPRLIALADRAADIEIRINDAAERGDRETALLLEQERHRLDMVMARFEESAARRLELIRQRFNAKENALDRENQQRMQAASQLGDLRRTVLQNQAEARRLLVQLGNDDPFRAAAALQGGLLAGETPGDVTRTALNRTAYGSIPGMNVNPYTAPMEQVGNAITGLEQQSQFPQPAPSFAPLGMMGGGVMIQQDAPTPNTSGPTGVGVLVGERGPEVLEMSDQGVRVIPLATRAAGGMQADWSGLARNWTPQEQAALIIMDEANKRGMDGRFAALTAAAESGLNPNSPGDQPGYTGLYQLGPYHQPAFFNQGYTNLHDARQQAAYTLDAVKRAGNWNQWYGAGRVVGAAGIRPTDGTTYTGPLYRQLGPIAPYMLRTPIGGAGGLTASPLSGNTPLGMPQETTTQGIQQQPTVQQQYQPPGAGATPLSTIQPIVQPGGGTPLTGPGQAATVPGDRRTFIDSITERIRSGDIQGMQAAAMQAQQMGFNDISDQIQQVISGNSTPDAAIAAINAGGAQTLGDWSGLAPEPGRGHTPQDEVRWLDDLAQRWPNVTPTDIIAAGQYGMFGVKDIIAAYLAGSITADDAYGQLQAHVPNIQPPGGPNAVDRGAMASAIQVLWQHLGLSQTPFTQRGALGSPQFSGWPGAEHAAPAPGPEFARTALDRYGVAPRMVRMSTTGQVFTIDNDGVAHAVTNPGFASAAELRFLGFNPANIMEMTPQELAAFAPGGKGEQWMFGEPGMLRKTTDIIGMNVNNPGTGYEEFPNLQVPMIEPVTGLLLPQPRMISSLIRRLDPQTRELIMRAYDSAGIYSREAFANEADAYTPVGSATGEGSGFLR